MEDLRRKEELSKPTMKCVRDLFLQIHANAYTPQLPALTFHFDTINAEQAVQLWKHTLP